MLTTKEHICADLSLSSDMQINWLKAVFAKPLPPLPTIPLLSSLRSTGTEWTCTKRRMLAGIITDYAYGLGYMLLAGVAYLIRDWRKLQLAISAPGFLLSFYIWWEIQLTSEYKICPAQTWKYTCISMSVLHVIIPHFLLFSTSLFDLSMPTRVLPHSARWLLANNRREEAIALLRKAALVNGRVLPPTVQVCVCVRFRITCFKNSVCDSARLYFYSHLSPVYSVISNKNLVLLQQQSHTNLTAFQITHQ